MLQAPERAVREDSSIEEKIVTIKMKISSPALEPLAEKYMRAKRFVLQWLYEHKTTSLKEVHKALYEVLREKFGLKSKLAQDCYRDAIATYKSWLENPKKGRFPILRNISLWLTPKASYTVDFNTMTAKILGEEVKIIGYPHNLTQYKDFKVKEARLVKRGDYWYLNVTMKKKVQVEKQVKGLMAVDINMDFITLGNDKQVIEIPTRLHNAFHFRKLAENLQKKYQRRWRENKRILNRIRSFHIKAKNIVQDFARKVGKWVVEEAKRLGANYIVLEDLNKMISHVKGLKKDYRDRLYLMQYRRVQHWIEWEAKKHGLNVIYVKPAYSSTTCPRCGYKLKGNGYRMLKCEKCGFEDHRDYIAVCNLYGRGSLTLSTASQMRDVNPNQWEEPSPF
ncbi:RNA-guided endonuclease TnpB family protein [Sulfolobus tengchongensis]|uniref:RNA-guided endonuclease TnpB family protein n=1 Tax=Sulfolobus tengchongensis TaxID=207809 RepID=A0AAX4KYQ3_9CREN